MKETEIFDYQGYVIVKELFSQLEIERLTKIVDRIYDQWLNESRAEFIEHKLVNMHSLTNPRYFQDHEAERLLFFQTIASDRLTKAP